MSREDNFTREDKLQEHEALAPYVTNIDYNSQLIINAASGNIEAFSDCLNYVADPHFINIKNGNNTAHYAAANNRVDMYKFISKLKGFNPNQLNNLGYTYLHVAAEFGHEDMVKYLVKEYGFDLLMIEDFEGRNAAQVAIDNGHKNIAKYLASKVRLAEEKARDGKEDLRPQQNSNRITIEPETQAIIPPQDSAAVRFRKFLHIKPKDNITNIIALKQKKQKHVTWDLSFNPQTPAQLQNILSQEADAKYISLNLSNLHSLTTDNLNVNFNVGVVGKDDLIRTSQADIIKIIAKFPALKSIDFGYRIQLSNDIVISIAPYMQRLTSLKFSMNFEISDEAIAKLVANLPKLTSLSLPCGRMQNEKREFDSNAADNNFKPAYDVGAYTINDTTIEIITKGLPNLTSLNLAFCRTVTDAGIKIIATNLPNLQDLDVSMCEITDDGMKSIARLSNLTSLNVANCFQLTDVAIKKIDKLANLTSLNVTNCYQITAAGIKTIAANLPELTCLNLSWLSIVTDAEIEKIAKKMPKLTSLNLSHYGCDNRGNITDAGIKIIAEKMPQLTSLNLASCDKISNVGIGYLANMHNLRYLNLNMQDLIGNNGYNFGIRNNGLAQLQALLPATKIIDICGVELQRPEINQREEKERNFVCMTAKDDAGERPDKAIKFM